MQQKIRNTTGAPIAVNLSLYNKDGSLAKRRIMSFIPLDVTADPSLGPGVVQVPAKAWEEAKKMPQVQRKLAAGQLVEIN